MVGNVIRTRHGSVRLEEPGEPPPAKAERFNRLFSPGQKINVWTGPREGAPVERIVGEGGAYVLGGHTAVVHVVGGGGCIALTHVVEFIRGAR